MSWMAGTGIAVKARQRWRSLPFDGNIRFVDDRTIAELRAEHPEWRAQSLAPVSIIDDVSLLPSLPDESLDYVVAYHLLMDGHKVYQSLDTAARLLRAGGTLVIPVPDDRYVSDSAPEVTAVREGLQLLDRELGEDGSSHGSPCYNPRLSCDRLAAVMGRLATSQRATLDLEAVLRNGVSNIVVFRKQNNKFFETGSLICRDTAIYVVDGPVIRYVPTLEILGKIRKSQPINYLEEREFFSLVIGPPLLEDDVVIILRKMEDYK